MKPAICFPPKKYVLLSVIIVVIFWTVSPVFSYPIKFSDDRGNPITIGKRPSRVVSLVPSVTEILFKIGAGDTVTGITYHNTYPPETVKKEIVGGFFSPSLERIESMDP
ncbi:MAG: ABC transporter substrate-binding protein, partial [Deltaproteobacteria bacterium]|nr:ABC transporter substrate-binding protein [Deltaproteobacteria bacterium]